jgi:CNT family concentrative nucleoside transporter
MIQSLLGFSILVFIAWLLSERRLDISWKTVAGGIALQWMIAWLLLGIPASRTVFVWLNDALGALQAATEDGTAFVFGYLGGAPLPFEERQPGASFVLAFRALPLVLVISALSALLYYWRVMPFVVGLFSRMFRRFMGVSGAIGVGAAANIFVGMVEAPLLVKPFLRTMDRGGLFAIMSCGMATIAGTMIVLYATILGPVLGEALGHILTASIISAPAAILVAALMVPSRDAVSGRVRLPAAEAAGSMDAVTRGALDGLKLYLNILAMLVVLVALVSLANRIIGLVPSPVDEPLTLQLVLGYVFAPLVWCAGIPWDESLVAGALMGTKTVLNEFIAYLDLVAVPEGSLSPRSRLIMVYALCGFANFGSLGIMIGGLTTLIPERRQEVIGLGFKSIVAGTLATLMTGSVVSVIAF